MYSGEDKKKIFIIFCFFLTFAACIVVTMVWNADSYYTDPIRAISGKKEEEPVSNQPKAPGFRESDIKKYKGDRYSIY